jgi:hypothetical protein
VSIAGQSNGHLPGAQQRDQHRHRATREELIAIEIDEILV